MCTQKLLWLSCGHARLEPVNLCSHAQTHQTCTVTLYGDHRIIHPQICDLCCLCQNLPDDWKTTPRPIEGSEIARMLDSNAQYEREVEEMLKSRLIGEPQAEPSSAHGMPGWSPDGNDIDWNAVFMIDEATIPQPAPESGAGVVSSLGGDAAAPGPDNAALNRRPNSSGSIQRSSSSEGGLQDGALPVELEDLLQTDFGNGFDLRDEMRDF